MSGEEGTPAPAESRSSGSDASVHSQSMLSRDAIGSPHVCLFPGQLQLGGVGRVMINLAEEMLSRGVRVDIFMSKRAGAYLPKVPAEARIIEGGGGSVRASIPHLIRYLKRERPHLLVSARPYINLAAILATRLARVGTRVVATEHTSTLAEDRFHGGLRRRAIQMACRFLYPASDQVVAVSHAVAHDVAQVVGLAPDQIRVIYNPVVTPHILELSREDIRDTWLDSSSSPIVLGIGRLTLAKDFSTLIRAFARLREGLDARLVIVGEGEQRESLEALVDDLSLRSYVQLPGYVENPFAYLARSRVFVLSSHWEGLPTALIEALAVGTPVVSTDCPGGSREILADGEFGEIVPLGDVDALAYAIRAAIEDPPPPGGLMERASRFSAARATDEYLSLMGPAG